MRGKPIGALTRGTTAPNRLRRVDAWVAGRVGHRLRVADDPLVVDLGYGASPVTSVEFAARLAEAAGRRVRLVCLEIDPVRVADAQPMADPPWLEFRLGGFELAGLRPVLVRAMNVLRQYDEAAVAPAWATMTRGLADGGLLVEGTCDEPGRVACWVALEAGGPRTLTLAADLSSLDNPAVLAERLPKALIHHNVPGERIHDLISALERAWRSAAGYAPFGPRQRWVHAVAALRTSGWPVLGGPAGWRRGEVTVRWSAVAR